MVIKPYGYASRGRGGLLAYGDEEAGKLAEPGSFVAAVASPSSRSEPASHLSYFTQAWAIRNPHRGWYW
jgi:hypothetical protein